MEYNGIDALSEEDNIQIQISNYHIDISDIDYIELYRFNLTDYYNNPETSSKRIKTLSFPGSYLLSDDFADGDLPLSKNWFYYIKSYDAAGNYSISDTVCYKILEKPILVHPADGAVYSRNRKHLNKIPTPESVEIPVTQNNPSQNQCDNHADCSDMSLANTAIPPRDVSVPAPNTPPRRSERIRRVPNKYTDFVM